MSLNTTVSKEFLTRKDRILSALSLPESDYKDLSPKGSIDAPIRQLIDHINNLPGLVTTSSCSGRIAVYQEGHRILESVQSRQDQSSEQIGGDKQSESRVGGKGGGKWLYVSHEPVDLDRPQDKDLCSMLGMSRISGTRSLADTGNELRWIHFKFEPFILHLLTASLDHAQAVVSAAEHAGFRESGARGLTSAEGRDPTPMVAVRSMGLSLETLVGYVDDITGEAVCILPDEQLEMLLRISKKRFEENERRIERFQTHLSKNASDTSSRKKGQDGDSWEDVEIRRQRKKLEGLNKARQEEAGGQSAQKEVELAGSMFHEIWDSSKYDHSPAE